MGITFPPQMRTGSPEAMAVQNIGRQQAFILRQQLALGKLNMGTRRVTLNNGIEITCTYCFGKEDIWVKIPPVLTSQSLEVKTEYTMLVCVPRALAADNGFALTDVKTQYGMDVSADPEFKYGTASKVTEVERGNYCIQAEDGTVYSIVAPPHHMAGEPDNKTLIPGYTRYAWTTNVTGLDIHTCYSEYVYSKGKAVFTGTPAPPESEFFSGLIVGVGVDADGNIHVAQLSGIGTGQGYWMVKSKGVDVGVFFGTESGAAAEADKLGDGSYAVIWQNETAARWWVEFHSTNCPASGLLPKTLNIYRREQATRPGLGNRQWFFDPEWEEWSQIATSVPNELIFEGFKYVGSLKNTVYKFLLGAEKVNEKPVTLTHKATSLSGATGTFTEVDMKVYRETVPWDATFSGGDGWPNAGSKYFVDISKDVCDPASISVSCTLPNTSVTGSDGHYEVTMGPTTCVPGQSAELIEGEIIVSGGSRSETMPLSYTSAAGHWGNYTLTWNSPAVPYSERLESDIVSGNTRTVTHITVSPYPSYQETYSIVACNYCSDNYPSTRVYTSDPGSYTRAPSYLIEPLFALTSSGTDIASNMPCCEYIGMMSRNYWYLRTRRETYEWVCP